MILLDEIVGLLVRSRRPTFVTRDLGFFRASSVTSAAAWCAWPSIARRSPSFLRRLLRHPDLDSTARRLGLVLRVSSAGIRAWSLHASDELFISWN
jgi:hypothetical protein